MKHHHQTVGIVLGWFVIAGFPQGAEPPSPSVPDRAKAPSEAVDPYDTAAAEKPLAELLRDLKSRNVTTRRKAAFGLFWKPPPHDPAAIPPLVEALRDEDAHVRGNAALALEHYGSQAKAAVPALLEIAKKKGDGARLSAVSTLGKIGPASSVAVTVLIEMLAEKSFQARQAAATALGRIGREVRPAVTSLREAMADDAAPVRVAAATALWQISGSAKESVPVLIGVLRNTDVPDDFELIASEIGRDFGLPMPLRLPREASLHRRRCSSFGGGYRGEAAKVLGEMGQDARAAVPALRKVAKEDSSWVQFNAASALVRIAPESVEIVPAFRTMIREEDKELQSYVLMAGLDRLGSKERTALLPAVIEALNDKSALVRLGAMIALKKLGPAAEKAAPSLFKILQSDDELGSIAASALESIGPQAKAIVPQLISLLKDGNAKKRVLAVNTLAAIGPKAAAAVPILVKTLRDSDKDVCTSAANALRKIDSSVMPKEYGNR